LIDYLQSTQTASLVLGANALSPRKVAILEDNLDRQAAMQALLTAHFPTHEHSFCNEAEPFIGWLRLHLAETLFISLDHDLELKPTGDGRWYDPGTGRMVAEYLATCAPVCPIIIHSTKRNAVRHGDAVARKWLECRNCHSVWRPSLGLRSLVAGSGAELAFVDVSRLLCKQAAVQQLARLLDGTSAFCGFSVCWGTAVQQSSSKVDK
jgi:hypothetical protein